jgi:hypothetical protein
VSVRFEKRIVSVITLILTSKERDTELALLAIIVYVLLTFAVGVPVKFTRPATSGPRESPVGRLAAVILVMVLAPGSKNVWAAK